MMSAGLRRHLVSLSNPGVAVPDGDGGYTQTLTAISPSPVWAEIKPATRRDLERLTAGTVISTESLIVTIPFHSSVTTKTVIGWTDPAGRAHTANVVDVNNPENRCIDLILVVVEVVD